MTLNEFHAMLGETIMFCQTIEHDIKWIYAGIKPGNIYENFQSIASWTLGETLKQLEVLGGPAFSANDYRLLKRIMHNRNKLVHESYRNFIYTKNYYYSENYQKECISLKQFHEQLTNLHKIVEKARLDILKSINRI